MAARRRSPALTRRAFALAAILLAAFLPAAFLPAGAVQAQTPPDASAILKRVSDTYNAATMYDLKITEQEKRADGSLTDTVDVRMVFQNPDRYRMEGASLPIASGPGPASATIIYDGAAVWFYFPEKNQYFSIPASAIVPGNNGDLEDLAPKAVDGFILSKYRLASQAFPDVKFLRTETIDLDGAKVSCYVVSMSGTREYPAATWWIDATRYLVLREEDNQSVTVVRKISVNQPLPADSFRFEPPPGAARLKMDFDN